MRDKIDVLEILASQHAEIDQLFEQLESNEGNRAQLFAELADKLAAHAAVEEKIFYPAVMDAETFKILHESVEEHLAIKRLLADMLSIGPAHNKADFDAKLSVLKDEVSHHAHDEEEDKLFPLVRHLMSTDERAALGNEVLVMFEALIVLAPRRSVPGQTHAAADLPTR